MVIVSEANTFPAGKRVSPLAAIAVATEPFKKLRRDRRSEERRVGKEC